MPYEQPTTLEAFLEHHHIAMRIEFDGANKEERVFLACLPGMRVAGGGVGRSSFIIARGSTPAEAVAMLANALKGKVLRSEDESKRADFPNELNAESLVKKLQPVTEVEKLALSYVTDVAVRMVVAFSLTREAYDNLWRATMGASLLQAEEKGQLLVPITIENGQPLLAMKDIAWQLGGKLLLRRDMEFHAPVLPNVRHTLQEEIRVGRKNRKE